MHLNNLIMNDEHEVLRFKFPVGVTTVGFADDLTLKAYGELIDEVQLTAVHSINVVEEWVKSRKLESARYKTVMVVVSNRKTEQQAVYSVGDCTITSKRSVKHLWVMIDDNLTCGSHVGYVCKRVYAVIVIMSWIMSNSSAVHGSKRKLLNIVTSSILWYGGKVWGTALSTYTECYYGKLEITHRLMCLRVMGAYRTAFCVTTGIVPIRIFTGEDIECFEMRSIRGKRRTARFGFHGQLAAHVGQFHQTKVDSQVDPEGQLDVTSLWCLITQLSGY